MIKTTMFPELTDPDGDAAFGAFENTWNSWAERNVRFFDAQIEAAQAELVEAGINSTVDELAIMVFDEHQEYHLIEQAVRLGGWEMFNAAIDEVETYPIQARYSVHYTFLRHPERNYRLEVMRLVEGVSPLHNSLATRLYDAGWKRPVVVHASFKVANLSEFGDAEQSLLFRPMMLVQGCRSTYGAFAYFAPTQDHTTRNSTADLSVYLKPRVNMRDQA